MLRDHFEARVLAENSAAAVRLDRQHKIECDIYSGLGTIASNKLKRGYGHTTMPPTMSTTDARMSGSNDDIMFVDLWTMFYEN